MLPKSKRHIILIVLLIFIAHAGFGQETRITVKAEGQKLSQVLGEISSAYNIQFAFDADYFSGINVSFTYRDIPLATFLAELCQAYHLHYEIIGSTYVLFKNTVPKPETPIVYAQLRGQVTDKQSGEPLLFCHIALGEHKGTTTNELGIFNEKMIQEETITISISHLGYHRLDTTIALGTNVFHNIRLKPFSIHLEAINVYQQEKDVIEMGDKTGSISFNPKQSGNLPRVDDSDLITALSLIPGISYLGGQTSGISIRGSSPSENLILLDGIPVLETSHLFGNLSVLNAKFISQAFVSRGTFDATQGERTSGVIELTGKSNFYKPGFDLSANLLNVSATANCPVGKKISISGAYRKSYIDQWKNYLYAQMLRQITSTSEEDAIVEPDVSFDDLNLKISARPTDKQEISVNLLRSNDLQHQDFQFKETSRFFRDERMDSKNRGISGNWRYQSHPDWHHHLTIGYNDLTRSSWSYVGMAPNKQGKGGKEERDTDNNYLEELNASIASELQTGNITHQAGFGVRTNQVSYNYKAERTVGNIQVDSIHYNRQTTILHGFWQESIQINRQLQIKAGIRANYENNTGKIYLQPRGGIKLTLPSGCQLFYSGGIYHQFLSRILKIDSSGNTDLVWYLPDSTGMGILKSIQHAIGLNYEKNGFSANVEVYNKVTRGKTNLYAEIGGGKEKLLIYIPREGQSKSIGIDALFHYKQGKLTHMLASSLSKTTEQFAGFNKGESYPAFNDQRLKLRWTEMARLQGWILATNLSYHSGSPYLITTTDTSEPKFDRLPFFAQADLSVIKNFSVKHFSVTTGLSLLNLFNRKNIVEVDYFNISDATGSYSLRTDITATKFVPSFFISIKTK